MFTFTRNRLIALIAILVVLGGVVGITACSGGSSAPQNATQVLQSDGYTPSATYTSALQSGLNSGGGTTEITSSEAGTNSAGDIQGVVVFDNGADATAGATGAGSSPGITVATNGSVVTLTGSESAWAALG
jgi:hypothetical protein